MVLAPDRVNAGEGGPNPSLQLTAAASRLLEGHAHRAAAAGELVVQASVQSTYARMKKFSARVGPTHEWH
jgi:hypothetical protein